MPKSIEVDVTDAIEANADAIRAGVDFEVVQANGPGGGNPLVRVSGDEDKVDALLESWGYSPGGFTMDEDEDFHRRMDVIEGADPINQG